MKIIKIFILSLSIILTGCVTGTRNVDLVAPAYENDKSSNGLVYISGIRDGRKFEAKPASPSTPSVKGDLSAASEEKLSTLIGRQRNGYGKALGDVALPLGGTVQNEVRDLLITGLEGRGYTVTEDSTAANAIHVDIEQFWAWFSPGFWSVSFEANVQSNLSFSTKSGEKKINVRGYGINKGQVGSDANWALAYERAFSDFLVNLDKALDSEGL